MHEFISFRGQIISAGEAEVSAVSSACLYGKGIFTTVAVYDTVPFLVNKHWPRLMDDSSKLKINLAEFLDDGVNNELVTLIRLNRVSTGRARITFFDESASQLWPVSSSPKTSMLITTGDFRPVPENFRLTVSPYILNSRSPLTGVKSCSYLDKILTLNEAKSRGFDEAVQLNERGEIASATMANVFWSTGSVLYTPSLKTGCLKGTTREFVLENLECREVEAGIEMLKAADAIFLTSAGIGIVSVNEFDGRTIADEKHPISELIFFARKAGFTD